MKRVTFFNRDPNEPNHVHWYDLDVRTSLSGKIERREHQHFGCSFYAICDVPDEIENVDVAAAANELRFVELAQKQSKDQYIFTFNQFCTLLGVAKFEAFRKRLEADRAAEHLRREEEYLGRGPTLHRARAAR